MGLRPLEVVSIMWDRDPLQRFPLGGIEYLKTGLHLVGHNKIFPNDEAIIRLLYLNIRNFSHRWTARQGWDSVMSQLSIMYPDRVRAEAMEAAA